MLQYNFVICNALYKNIGSNICIERFRIKDEQVNQKMNSNRLINKYSIKC